ncbi:MAG: peptidylprolyl isomerase [Bacteroidetes bacterium]|jgi:cyclophilin family peptidyl-prolyl cis-trans isomerase|nr:peptidylprolyl isomerase [Bacteroidota bacterium]MBK8671860.1 peptidylprolyl isomerase [Bacteroidota bacterium]MBK9355321.1 peptidylprolyl isomerase [Bacteroidota bacterium]MBL0078939.1 peptidylprolyl isomerase [Bacteroidota bacterium]MBP9136526.1 peptidylprolyl isomerase [Chitinophagales bacterium]
MKKILSFATLVLLVSFVEAQTTKIKMKTSMGTIKLVLYDETPLHRDNFIKLVKEKYYDGLLFHRVIDSFVVQGGDPNSKLANDTALLGEGDLGYTILAEIMPDKYYHKKGALGMARDDNPEKASSACQFYIVEGKISNDSIIAKAKLRTGYTLPVKHEEVYRKIGGIPHLDSNYTVFGEVTKGMKVVNKISKVKKDENDRPIKNVYILKMSIAR